MPIKYKVIAQSEPGLKGGGNYKYYARACQRENIGLDYLAELIAARSTLSKADLWATMAALLDSIPELLKEGNNVSMGGFGTFSLSLSSAASNSADKVNAKSITKTNVQFRPGVAFKRAMQDAKFKKVKG